MVGYLSPSALSTYLNSPEEFYLKYMVADRPPRIPQNQVMAVGSAFDAYIKTYVNHKVLDKSLRFREEFEKQVEPQNREQAEKDGAKCYTAYKNCGAIDKLLHDIGDSPVPPRMEFVAEGQVTFTEKAKLLLSDTDLSDLVNLYGKPDLQFQTSTRIPVIKDWKVNGFYRNYQKPPVPGYILLLDPSSKKHGATHRDAHPAYEGNIEYNLNNYIEMQDENWARQITTYSWLAGIPVGGEMLVGIDQLNCNPGKGIAVAIHYCRISPEFQVKTYKMYQELWNIMHSDHFFRTMNKEESQQRQKLLASQGAIYKGDDAESRYLNSLRTGQYT